MKVNVRARIVVQRPTGAAWWTITATSPNGTATDYSMASNLDKAIQDLHELVGVTPATRAGWTEVKSTPGVWEWSGTAEVHDA